MVAVFLAQSVELSARLLVIPQIILGPRLSRKPLYNGRMENTGIKQSVLESIVECARRHGLARVVLFGSRARGSHRPKSDIDLALAGGDQTRFVLDLEEEAPTLLRFDFVNLDGPASPELLARIQTDGKVLYEEAR